MQLCLGSSWWVRLTIASHCIFGWYSRSYGSRYGLAKAPDLTCTRLVFAFFSRSLSWPENGDHWGGYWVATGQDGRGWEEAQWARVQAGVQACDEPVSAVGLHLLLYGASGLHYRYNQSRCSIACSTALEYHSTTCLLSCARCIKHIVRFMSACNFTYYMTTYKFLYNVTEFWTGYYGYMYSYGGPVTIMWGYLATTIGTLCMAFGMSEVSFELNLVSCVCLKLFIV